MFLFAYLILRLIFLLDIVLQLNGRHSVMIKTLVTVRMFYFNFDRTVTNIIIYEIITFFLN